jgi:Rrf2 family transcriptional regulator, iron-sulfur cluster assembly transcription factor
MHFSKTAEYAIRVLSYLHYYGEKSHSANVLHKELSLPYKYLTKLMTELVKKGLVQASRGRDGGFSLAKDANAILLSDILEAVGEPSEFERCILGFETCNALNPCDLHNNWIQPKKMIEAMLHITLDSLVHSQNTKL